MRYERDRKNSHIWQSFDQVASIVLALWRYREPVSVEDAKLICQEQNTRTIVRPSRRNAGIHCAVALLFGEMQHELAGAFTT
jgi:hypothetical protein